MIISQKFINNSHCKVLLPFTNTPTENRAKGGSHVVTNSGVVIRTLSNYSIPDCPNGAKKAAYFDGSSFLSIPYSEDFEFFGKEPILYQFWIYPTTLGNMRFLDMYKDSNESFSIYLADSNKNILAYVEVAGIPRYLNNNNKLVDTMNSWYLIEIQGSIQNKLGIFGTGATSYISGVGINNTSVFATRTTPLNATAYIGQYYTGIQRFTGYMSEFTIIKGDYRISPSTYNPTRIQSYYSLPKKIK